MPVMTFKRIYFFSFYDYLIFAVKKMGIFCIRLRIQNSNLECCLSYPAAALIGTIFPPFFSLSR
jgi:hypothetical protein